jgi:hypothetical protein
VIDIVLEGARGLIISSGIALGVAKVVPKTACTTGDVNLGTAAAAATGLLEALVCTDRKFIAMWIWLCGRWLLQAGWFRRKTVDSRELLAANTQGEQEVQR